MIALHRITQPDQEFFLNPDLIQVVEAHPDTVITLTNGSRYVVAETPAEVVELVQEQRAAVLTRALTASEDGEGSDRGDPPRVTDALARVLKFPTPQA
jgi:flagellar protein FlbD